ncbi:unnamed protein product, partial [Rotaria sp. Silwood1]
GYPRPVIIFGACKEIINDQLMTNYPDKFSSCVPHTTRAKRDQEVDGQDYHFSNREQMEEDIQNELFIEAGEHRGNLYGTSVNAVRDVLDASKHCVLDVTGNAIKRLIGVDLYPIVIYIKPRDIKWILNNMGEEANEVQAKQIYNKCNDIEQQYGDLFTTTIEEEDLNGVYKRICDIIDHESRVDSVRIRSKEKIY